jgi:hypothetical protein
MRWILQAGTVALAIVAALVPLAPGVVERWYSTGVYPRLRDVLAPLSERTPFAWLDVLSVGAALVLLVMIWRGGRRAWRERTWRPAAALLANLATVAAVAYLIFLLVWGLNYRRVPMLDRVVLESGAPTTDAVVALGTMAVERLNALHADAHAAGWPAPWDDPVMRAAFARVQDALSGAEPARPGRLKGTLYGPYFRWTGVDGMVNPFGLEVLGNPDLLPVERPFVAAHEWAHLAGYADESEASFVGWLTCVHGGPGPAYSAWLHLYWLIRAEVPAGERPALAEGLAEGPRADLEAIAARLRRGQVQSLRAASQRVYDGYLRANRVDEGIRSYGLVINLLLRTRFEGEWEPVRRDLSRE